MIIKADIEYEKVIYEIIQKNHHLKIVDEDYEDDAKIYLVEVQEKTEVDQKQKIRQATEEWIEKSFQAIPYDIILKAFVESETAELKILTSELDGEGYEYLTYSNFPTAIHSFFLVNDKLDIEWILDNIEIMDKHGFDVYESDRHLFIAIEGMGYDHVNEHWIPLYLDRGYKWQYSSI